MNRTMRAFIVATEDLQEDKADDAVYAGKEVNVKKGVSSDEFNDPDDAVYADGKKVNVAKGVGSDELTDPKDAVHADKKEVNVTKGVSTEDDTTDAIDPDQTADTAVEDEVTDSTNENDTADITEADPTDEIKDTDTEASETDAPVPVDEVIDMEAPDMGDDEIKEQGELAEALEDLIIQSLEDIDEMNTIESIVAGIPEDDMTDTAAELATESLNRVYARLGITDFSLEDIPRLTGTVQEEKQDNFMDKLKKIFDAIVKAVTNMWNATINFIMGVFNSAIKLKNEAMKVTGLVEKIVTENPNAKINGDKFVVAYGVDRAGSDIFKSAMTVIDNHTGFLENATAFNNAVKVLEDGWTVFGKEIVKILFSSASRKEKSKKIEDAVVSINEGLLKGIQSVFGIAISAAGRDPSIFNDSKNKNIDKTFTYGPFIGETYVMLYATHNEDLGAVGYTGVEIASKERNIVNTVDSKINALKKDEMLSLAGETVNLAEKVIKYKPTINNVKRLHSALDAVLKSIAEGVRAEADKMEQHAGPEYAGKSPVRGIAEMYATIQKVISESNIVLAKVSRFMLSSSIKCGTTNLALVKASIAAHNVKPDTSENKDK